MAKVNTPADIKRSDARTQVHALATELYREERPRLLAIARHHATNSADAEEALHDAFTLFIDKFNPSSGAPPLAWLILTLKRGCWAKRKREHLNQRLGQGGDTGVPIAELPSQATGPEEALERTEDLLDRRQRFAALKPSERRTLLLIGAGYSYKEIGQLTGYSYAQTNRYASKGRRRLRAPTR